MISRSSDLSVPGLLARCLLAHSAVISLAVFTAAAAWGQSWTNEAFPVKSHDFGTVAVASKTEFRFPVHNTTGQTLHIASARTSCGCTTAVVETPYIEPGQSGAILARYNTDTHRGQKGATITVVINQPSYAEVRLRVSGYIRQDLVFRPGMVDFGRQSVGQELSKTIQLLYAGRSDWAVTDVVSHHPWMSGQVKLESRSGGSATYLLTVRVDRSAPPGPFQDELVIVTNDRSRPRVPLLVSGELQRDLVVSPQSLAVGAIKPGEVVEKRLVVRGHAPFVVESIRAKGWQVDFDPVDEAKTTHMVNVRLTPAADTNGQVTGRLVVTTSGDLETTAAATITAIVRNP